MSTSLLPSHDEKLQIAKNVLADLRRRYYATTIELTIMEKQVGSDRDAQVEMARAKLLNLRRAIESAAEEVNVLNSEEGEDS